MKQTKMTISNSHKAKRYSHLFKIFGADGGIQESTFLIKSSNR
jgi:hypothetical protein